MFEIWSHLSFSHILSLYVQKPAAQIQARPSLGQNQTEKNPKILRKR